MPESLTISKKIPDSKSLQYDFLREQGIEYIQKLAGKIWTDYNVHDPGVSTLEVLCYAITELGYRANYPVKDLLTLDPNNIDNQDIKNFFTAREILPNCPLTINDYRKLLIDVNVPDPLNNECKHVGIKNAWIEKSEENEIPVYVNRPESKIDYQIPIGNPGQSPLDIGILYDILLEFEKCDAYGDLNENSLIENLLIEEHTLDPKLEGLIIKIAVEFPRWDNEDTDWEEVTSIKSNVHNIKLQFSNVPDSYELTYELINNVVKLKGTITTASDIVDIPGLSEIEAKLNAFIYYENDSMLAFYLQKVGKIEDIIQKVKARLHANRNLCEDFYRLSALKVEKIAICADIELEPDADVDKVQAEMYHQIGKFLSPTVHFYSLDEMLNKCKQLNEYSIEEIDITNKYFTVSGNLEEIMEADDEISISGSRSNDGDYIVKSITVDTDAAKTKIFVEEDITSDLLTEAETLSFFTTNDDNCLGADQIFEGPALEHGFIDDVELEQADRKKFIHVSDLIQIIMDIPGVTAVRSIQIANIPQDNEDGSIASKSVKWCMQLAYDQNYVPRLSMLDSKLTFYKDQLPFRASSAEVEKHMDVLEKSERISRLFDPVVDFEIPSGTYRDLESFESIQNEFPLTYGIGEEGVATLGNDPEANTMRLAQARQFKGYLMIFDQLLANYFSQLAHVKDLFSMNPGKDELGNYIIGRTYYTQPLFDIVPDVDVLYLDKNGHETTLNNITETKEDFYERKNKFLDHLIGRFAESFTDYALLTMKLSGELKAPAELIEDKLAFLNAYPEVSAARGKGFNHQEPCKIWHNDNISGMRTRASFLVGIDETAADKLKFKSNFEILPEAETYRINVSDNTPTLLLKSNQSYDTEEEAKLEVEKMIINGSCKDNYKIISEDAINYRLELYCRNDELLGISERLDYPDDLPGGEADLDIDTLVVLFKNEFFNNPEANRNNLACPLLNYLDYSVAVDMEPDPPVTIVSYNLYSAPLAFNPSDKILSGQYIIEGDAKSEVDIISVNTGAGQIEADGNIAAKLLPDDIIVITDSQDNDGTYTVVSASEAGGNTLIIVNETIPSNNIPLGELLYNNDSSFELMVKAEDSLYEILWQLIDNAVQESNYYFSSDSGAYRFRIIGNTGLDIGESIDADFNDPLADEITNLASGQISITESTANDGDYDVANATANGPDVDVTILTTFPSNDADGKLNINEAFTYTSNTALNTFNVAGDLTNILFEKNTVSITGSESVDGSYTISSIVFNGTASVLTVEETIPAEDSTGELCYTKLFEITGVSGNQVTINGGYEHKAVESFIGFIKENFFSHEGFHVLEHVLLRPKVKGPHFIDANEETLTEGLADYGSLFFNKTLPIFSAGSASRAIRIDGNITSEIDNDPSSIISSEISVSGTGANDGTYTVSGVQYNSGSDRTRIKTEEEFPMDIPFTAPIGEISYMKGTPITYISAAGLSITIADPESLNVLQGEAVEIRGASEGINDGRYKVDMLNDLGSHQEVVISLVETEIEDKLLNIVLEENDCDDCQIEDPYTCIASVILPHWQGRFDNMDFRRFFERQIRMEAPAHVFLIICWISCEQMQEFEEKYIAWLIENTRLVPDYGKLSEYQNKLVDILNDLRNVYPSGYLHDCEEDETLENAIILNNSVLGNA